MEGLGGGGKYLSLRCEALPLPRLFNSVDHRRFVQPTCVLLRRYMLLFGVGRISLATLSN